MKLMSIRELRNHSGRIQQAVREGTVALTSNGKPFALVVGIDEDADLTEMDRTIVQARGLLALRRLQAAAAARGLEGLAPEEIDAEIRAARRE